MATDKSTQQGPVVLEPGVMPCYRNAWQQLWKYPLEIFLIFIIFIIITMPGSFSNFSVSVDKWIDPLALIFLALFGTVLGIFGTIYSILVSGPVNYGFSYAYLRAARGELPEVKDVFEGFKTYWNVVLASLIVNIIVVIGFILLVVPGIVFACKLAFVPFLVIDRKMEAVAAVRESWQMTNGYAPDVFYIGLLGIPILIAGAICLGVGIIVSCMWISLAIASLYHAVSLKKQTSQQSPMQ